MSLQACAREGAKVIATDINEEKLTELQGIDGTYICTDNYIFVYSLVQIMKKR